MRIWGYYCILKINVTKYFQNMNKDILLSIFIGKIISDIQFDFIIEGKSIGKNISVVRFKLELLDKQKTIINVIAYGKIAEKCFQKLIKSDIVSMYGVLNSNGELEIEEIELQ